MTDQDTTANETPQFDPMAQAEADLARESDPAQFQYPRFGAEESDEDVPEATEIEVEEEPNPDDIESAYVREDDPQNRPVGYDKFKKVFADWKKAEREIEYLKVQNRQIYDQFQKDKGNGQHSRQADQDLQMPDYTDYDDINKYEEARDNYNREMGRREALKAQNINPEFANLTPEQIQARQKSAYMIFQHQSTVDKDFAKNGYVPGELTDYVAGSDKLIELAYYFAHNRAFADQLKYKSPQEIAQTIGRLEASLRPYNGGKQMPRTQSRAPRGINSTASTGKTRTSKDPSKMSMEEYRAWRKSGGGN